MIADMGFHLPPKEGDSVIDAGGGCLLPGLHDHHIHLMALAASLDSLQCGPPDIQSAAALAALLSKRNTMHGSGWVRGVAYHPSVAGDIDRDWLDRYVPDLPVRIQHRGGRLWVLNSRALQELGVSSGAYPAGLEHINGRATGRLYEEDNWLRTRLKSRPPNLARVSGMLASYGITGVTDTTPTNGSVEWLHFQQSQSSGQLRQRVRMMGSQQITHCEETGLLERGEFKIHLLESRLPDPDTLGRDIAAAHASGRAVAIHCVTLTELVFALSALQSAGVRPGDRIEHASITPPDMLESIRDLGLRVVTQPHFITERGDQYREDVEPAEQPWLYRGANFLAAGIALAGGSDAPFGNPDPWRSMHSAVTRATHSGRVMTAAERLSPEQALSLFLSDAGSPGTGNRTLEPGARADLCLLDSPWEDIRDDLDSRHVRSTWLAGDLIYSAG